jgi:hypothetical protein
MLALLEGMVCSEAALCGADQAADFCPPSVACIDRLLEERTAEREKALKSRDREPLSVNHPLQHLRAF